MSTIERAPRSQEENSDPGNILAQIGKYFGERIRTKEIAHMDRPELQEIFNWTSNEKPTSEIEMLRHFQNTDGRRLSEAGNDLFGQNLEDTYNAQEKVSIVYSSVTGSGNSHNNILIEDKLGGSEYDYITIKDHHAETIYEVVDCLSNGEVDYVKGTSLENPNDYKIWKDLNGDDSSFELFYGQEAKFLGETTVMLMNSDGIAGWDEAYVDGEKIELTKYMENALNFTDLTETSILEVAEILV